jgi:hypothetical protein
MSLNYNLCDNWGWYIDIENAGSSYEKKQFIRLPLEQEHTNVKTIYNDDDEYNYYLHMNKKTDFNIEYHFNEKYEHLDNINDEDYLNTTLNIATTAMITAILTYMILFP